MSLYAIDKLPHYVTITARYGSDGDPITPTVEFHCPWLYGGCHFYPGCDDTCETWDIDHLESHGHGHERVHHHRCWLQDWFDNEAHSYAGPDFNDRDDWGLPYGVTRTGSIKGTFCGEYIEWEFAE
ncbi:hypothetical protein [Sinomonas susongensis]|uniref:hypothetical protein n=1 Tax=Sinomonas susongensis TaxID=1324851 RepID=UPI0011080CB9|nr:hypothetical protein [Sinomonas susongensis]